MLKITALSNGIDIAGISFPNNSLSFEISSGTIINIYLVVNKKKIFSSHYLDFLDSSDQQYVSPQAVINDLLVNNSTSGGGGGGGAASDITFAPNGDISATNVQTAIVEVRNETDTKISVKENTSNKSTNVVTDQASDTKYLSVKAVFDWVSSTYQLILTAANFGSFSSALTAKTTPVDADTVNISDSAASGIAKKLSWANIKATLKSYFDPLYAPAVINTVGVIITESGSSLSNFTQTGSAFTTSGGKFNITNSVGSISFGSYIRQTTYGTSNIEKNTITANVTVGTISSTSFGVGFTYYSQRSTFPKSLTIGLLMDSTNKGKIAFYFNNSTTGAVIGSSFMALNSGDVTNVKIQQIKDTYIVTWVNITQNQSISATYTYFLNNSTLNPTVVTNRPNTFNYSITALGGGTHLVDTYLVSNDENVQPDLLVYGDSIISGSSVGNIAKRAIDLTASSSQTAIQCIANGGNWVEDYNLTEILSIAPKKFLISIGINNLEGGDSAATVMTKYSTLITSLQSSGFVLGTTLFITTVRPYTSNANVPTLNALIRTAYTGSFIEVYYPFWSGSGVSMNSQFAATDGLHLNELGAFLESCIFISFFNLKTKPHINFTNKQIYADQQGRVAIGTGHIARYNADILRELRIGAINADNGFFIHGLGPSNGELYSGLYYNGSVYVYKDTSYAGYSNFAGDTYWWGATGVTAGNTTAAPAGLMRLVPTNGGKLLVGSVATVPHSNLQSAGSLAAKYVAVTGTYAILVTDFTIDCTANSFTVTLPTAVGCTGRIYIIKNSGAGTITMATTSSQTIDGVPPNPILTTALLRVQSTGANWITI